MHKNFWKQIAAQGPIIALAPMDGYCNSPFRRLNKSIAPDIITFAEFFSVDGLVHNPIFAQEALHHHTSEKPLIIQVFGNDPNTFVKAGKIIESYGVAGIDINMGCPAKKVVKCGYGSGLMLQPDIAYKIVEKLSSSVNIPVSVKTRLGWENYEDLIDFCKGIQNSGCSLITVHGRTYKQAFTGDADWTGIYELQQQLSIPVLGNGDVQNYDDGIQKQKNLAGFMIGRASFGNPWCFLPGGKKPKLSTVLEVMKLHADLVYEHKAEKQGSLQLRKHLIHYLKDFTGVKEYRKEMVSISSKQELFDLLKKIQIDICV